MPVNNKKQLNAIFGTSPQVDDEDDDNEDVQDLSSTIIDEDDLALSMADADDDYLPAPVILSTEATPLQTKDVDSDIDYSRRTIQSLVNRSQQLVEIALENAAEGDSRSVEVAAKSIDTALSAAERLVELHEKLNKLKNGPGKEQGSGNTYIQAQTINMTTDELLKKLEEKDTIDV